MSKALNRLTPLALANLTKPEKIKPGTHHDGGGLYLQTGKVKGAAWLFRYMFNGKARGIGLGPLEFVSLKDARLKSHECRLLLWKGIDPFPADAAITEQSENLEEVKSQTFKECALVYIEAHRSSWKSVKHASQWENTLETYAYPILGNLPVAQIDIKLVMDVLEPIWREKTETASRLRGRIESILNWATVRKFRTGENPAQWRGRLDSLLPKQSRIAAVKHHAALPYSSISAFFDKLAKQDGVAALAFAFMIYTATRTSETINATWSEINLDDRIWTIPAQRMKAAKEHRIPLSAPACELLKDLEKERISKYVFPGRKKDKPLSNMALLQLLKRMEVGELTSHGFRSTFRDWAAECTNHPREVQEAALAHTLTNKTEAAYQRGDLFAKRAALMIHWAQFCNQTKQNSKVIENKNQ